MLMRDCDVARNTQNLESHAASFSRNARRYFFEFARVRND
jgi:hypothetical protein